jgi:DNA-binding Lrp family transcriptional regulator
MIDLDTTDRGILALLGKNGRSNGHKISKELSDMRISLTDRAVLQRIARLQEKKIIQGYTTTLNPSILAEKNTSLILFKLVPSAERIEIERLDSYLTGASFCLSAARFGGTKAGFDYIYQLVFDKQKQFDLILSVILRRFGSIISEYVIYRSEITKQVPYRVSFETSLERKTKALEISLALNKNDNIKEKLRQFTDGICRCFEAKFVCLWLIDKKTDELTLTNAFGNYEYIPPEYAEISWNSIKLESILLTKNPVLINDLVNAFKGINVGWVTREKVLSYAGYPLEGKDRIVGILEIFNDKVFSPQDFEMASVLCEEVSSILSNDSFNFD